MAPTFSFEGIKNFLTRFDFSVKCRHYMKQKRLPVLFDGGGGGGGMEGNGGGGGEEGGGGGTLLWL